MKIAIVILNWNGEKLLEQFLPSIVNFSSELATIYVADNASTDHSIKFVKEQFPLVQIIENATNGGYAKGYNDALNSIEADIYCLINSDVEVTENWIPPILEVFKDEDNTAIIQPKLLDFKDKNKFEYAGAAGGFVDLYGYPYCRGRVFNHLEEDTNQYNDVTEIFWASGACFFIRAKVYHQL
ncbi:MAG: glycosyltransferase, partial [Flavobacteriaceae bacterium]